MRQVERARELLGVPWIHQGRDPAVGIDCAGLLLYAFEVEDDTVYGRNPTDGLFARRCEAHLGPAVTGSAQVGDVVLLGFGYRGPGRHIGVVGDYLYGGLSVIHTDSIVGRVVEGRFDERWQRRVRGVYRR